MNYTFGSNSNFGSRSLLQQYQLMIPQTIKIVKVSQRISTKRECGEEKNDHIRIYFMRVLTILNNKKIKLIILFLVRKDIRRWLANISENWKRGRKMFSITAVLCTHKLCNGLESSYHPYYNLLTCPCLVKFQCTLKFSIVTILPL